MSTHVQDILGLPKHLRGAVKRRQDEDEMNLLELLEKEEREEKEEQLYKREKLLIRKKDGRTFLGMFDTYSLPGEGKYIYTIKKGLYVGNLYKGKFSTPDEVPDPSL